METITKDITSINKLLQDIKNPVEKIEALNFYAEKIRSANINHSLTLSEEAIRLAESNDHKKGLARAYWNHGIACRLLAKYDEAIANLDKALQYYISLDDIVGQSKILNSKGNIFLTLSDYEKALYYLKKSLDILEGTEEHIQRAIVFSNMGLAHQETGDYPRALENYQKSMQIYSERSDKIPYSLYNNIGIVYQNIGDHATALEYYFHSLDACEEESNEVDKAFNLGNIAITYSNLKEYDNSIKYFRESLALIRKLNYKQAETNGLYNLADAYKKAGSYDKALNYLKQAIEISDSIGDKSQKASSLNLIGEVYSLIGEFELAKQFFEESLNISKAINDITNQITSYIQLGKLYKNNGNLDSALFAFMNAQQHAEQKKASKELIEIHKGISEIYSLMNKLQKALEHYKYHHKYEKELFDSNIDKRLKAIFIQNEIKAKEKEYQLAVKEKELYKLKNVELVSLNKRLQYLNNEIKEFLGIAVHDLKNPLSGIKAFSNKIHTRFEKYTSDEIKMMAFEMEKASIKMFELIANLLDVNAIETGNRNYRFNMIDLNEVALSIVNEYSEKAIAKEIKINFEGRENSNVYVDLTSIRQIVDNLVSNAVKFSPKGGNVFISITENSGHYEFHVRDEGPGLTANDMTKVFNKFTRMSARPTGGEISTGLGLYIAKKLTDANNGRIWCENQDEKGAEFVLELPSYESLEIPVEEAKKSKVISS
ncbi:MAG TPA: tetratricopeptide repeat protein [Ignavibacteria bacterium]